MSILSQAEKPGDRAVICTILGDAGMGKTSLAATFPKPVFIRIEDGIQSIPLAHRPDALPLVKNKEQLQEQLVALIKEKHDYKTVVIDSITQLEAMFVKDVVDNDPKNPRSINQALGGYGAGWQKVAELHNKVRDAVQELCEKGINVVFIAHADVSVVRPPDGDEYTRYDLRLNRKSMSPYTDNVDVVGYLDLVKFTTGDGERKQAVTDGTRRLITYPTPANVSKNRYGIDKDIPVKLGVNPLAEYIPILNKEKK